MSLNYFSITTDWAKKRENTNRILGIIQECKNVAYLVPLLYALTPSTFCNLDFLVSESLLKKKSTKKRNLPYTRWPLVWPVICKLATSTQQTTLLLKETLYTRTSIWLIWHWRMYKHSAKTMRDRETMWLSWAQHRFSSNRDSI